MMSANKIFFTFFLLLISTGNESLKAQSLSLIGELSFPEDYHLNGDSTGGSDCWGWQAPDGTQYAMMGTYYGTHFVRIPDLTVVDSLFGAQDNDYWYHRDIKTWRNYAFICGEMEGPECGVQVVDLSFLPDSVHHITTFRTASDSTSHNLSIDTANATAYILKSNYSGCRIVDISNPANPVDIGFINTGDIHDVYARNDTAWIAEGGNQAFSVWDCSDPSNPVLLGRIFEFTFGYCHNIWPSEDGKYFATGEETPNRTVKVWNATDLQNITLEGEYLAACGIVHNVHWMGDFLYLSHYESGVVVVNVSDPSNPFEADAYDNYPPSDTSLFNGCWGAFPFTQGGYVYGSTIEGKLTVLGFDPLGIQNPGNLTSSILGQPYPVPVHSHLTIPIRLQKGTQVKLSFHDILGREAAIIHEGFVGAGEAEISFEVNDFSPGLYFIRLDAEGLTETIPVVIE